MLIPKWLSCDWLVVSSQVKLEYQKEDEQVHIVRFTPQSVFWKIVSQFENKKKLRIIFQHHNFEKHNFV